jgi:hypothetical protein
VDGRWLGGMVPVATLPQFGPCVINSPGEAARRQQAIASVLPERGLCSGSTPPVHRTFSGSFHCCSRRTSHSSRTNVRSEDHSPIEPSAQRPSLPSTLRRAVADLREAKRIDPLCPNPRTTCSTRVACRCLAHEPSDAYSGVTWAPVPAQPGHRFRCTWAPVPDTWAPA